MIATGALLPEATPHRYTILDFPEPPAGRPYVYVNMVASTDGKIVVEGTERGLGSDDDRRLMRELRVHADVVLVGAATLRATGASPRLGRPELVRLREERGKSGTPIAATVSASGDLPLESLFFTATDFRAVVYLGSAVRRDRLQAISTTGRETIELPAERPIEWMLGHMRKELGARYLLLEGGSQLNGTFLDAGLIDEYFLTLAPRIVGGNGTVTPFHSPRPALRERLTELQLLAATPNPESGEVFLRYRVRR